MKNSKTDYVVFFRMCAAGKSNEQIAKAMGWKIKKTAPDPFKRVRATKSLARTNGINVNGTKTYLRGLRDELKVVKKEAKSKKVRKAQPKPKTQPKPKHEPQPAMAATA